jgi:predicted oxidoreductase (fatty acid repression mutant protein)
MVMGVCSPKMPDIDIGGYLQIYNHLQASSIAEAFNMIIIWNLQPHRCFVSSII